jgi:hypothetical protein
VGGSGVVGVTGVPRINELQRGQLWLPLHPAAVRHCRGASSCALQLYNGPAPPVQRRHSLAPTGPCHGHADATHLPMCSRRSAAFGIEYLLPWWSNGPSLRQAPDEYHRHPWLQRKGSLPTLYIHPWRWSTRRARRQRAVVTGRCHPTPRADSTHTRNTRQNSARAQN